MKVSTCLLGAALLLVPASAFAEPSPDFVQKAIEGDNSEIMLSRMAQDRAMSPAVRDYARRLERDHRMARDDAQGVGERLGLEPDREVTPEAQDERDRLAGLDGPDFDREFLQYMIDDHRNEISDFRDQADTHDDSSADLARRQLPTLEKHLNTALALNEREENRY